LIDTDFRDDSLELGSSRYSPGENMGFCRGEPKIGLIAELFGKIEDITPIRIIVVEQEVSPTCKPTGDASPNYIAQVAPCLRTADETIPADR